MKTIEFIKSLYEVNNSPAYMVGVPDSLLAPLLHAANQFPEYFDSVHVAPNEGNAVGMAAGYHMATLKIPFVYLQNSGLGNVINPFTSLVAEQVYDIPLVFIIGWRAEPNLEDEPQHKLMGLLTEQFLTNMDITYLIVDKYTTPEDLYNFFSLSAKSKFSKKAVLVKKNSFDKSPVPLISKPFELNRYEVLETLLDHFSDAVFVATTGKTSREIYEIRDRRSQSHENDFLNVGAMGHTSSIALGIALAKKNKKVVCIDGDGSLLMHLGIITKIAYENPENLVHVLINNMTHESVGGFENSNPKLNYEDLLCSVGYKEVYSIENNEQLTHYVTKIKRKSNLVGLIIRVNTGSKDSLGRPTTSPAEQKREFVRNLNK